jgi:hypothetical protein
VSGYQVISQASLEIRDIFFKALKEADPALGEVGETVSLAPPSKGNDRPLSLWLYLVTENEHSRNRPDVVENGVIQPPPLALTLYFLATPRIASDNDGFSPDEKISDSAKVLGVVLQTLHTRPVVTLNKEKSPPGNPDIEPASEQLHFSLCRLSIEELARIWEALDHPYRLSICFKVNIVRIDSLRKTVGKPVTEREFIAGRLKQKALR